MDDFRFKYYCQNDVVISRVERRHQGVNNYVYEMYSANSKEKAMNFLNRIPTSEIPPQFYIVVETPEGEWGKDIDGIYQDNG